MSTITAKRVDLTTARAKPTTAKTALTAKAKQISPPAQKVAGTYVPPDRSLRSVAGRGPNIYEKVEALLDSLTHVNPRIRNAVKWRLRASTVDLVRNIRKPNHSVKAIQTLVMMHKKAIAAGNREVAQAVERITNCIIWEYKKTSATEEVREAAVKALGAIGSTRKRVIPALIQTVKEDHSWRVRFFAVIAMSEILINTSYGKDRAFKALKDHAHDIYKICINEKIDNCIRSAAKSLLANIDTDRRYHINFEPNSPPDCPE